MPGIESLAFDLTDCSLHEQSDKHRGWMSSGGVGHMLRFSANSPDWPFDLTNPDAATDFYGRQCANLGGALLSMDVITVAGAEALRGLFKYHAPVPDSLAMYYSGILWLPFQSCSFQVNVEAMEEAPTGTREAVVMVVERDSWPEYEDARLRLLPSDEERWDHSFPGHPLTRVRRRLAEVIATARLDLGVTALPPYRIDA